MTFIKDPCGIVCIVVTYMAVLYADYVVTIQILHNWMQTRFEAFIYDIFQAMDTIDNI